MTSDAQGDRSISAAIDVTGFACDPASITRLLDREPSQTWREGDPLPRSTSKRRKSGWRLAAPSLGLMDLEPYASWLLDQLPQRIDLSSVTGDYSITLWFTVHVGDDAPAAHFSANTIRRLAELGASVDIDLYGGNEAD